MKQWIVLLLIISILLIFTFIVLYISNNSIYPDTPSNINVLDITNAVEFAKKNPYVPFIVKFNCPVYKSVSEIHKKLKWDHTSFKEHGKNIEIVEKMSIKERISKQEEAIRVYDENVDMSTVLLHVDDQNMRDVLGDDFFDKLGDFKSFFGFTIWCNTKDFTTPIHTDTPNNMTVQLLGKKRWILASPRYTKQLHPTVKGRASQFYNEKEYDDIKNNVKTLIVDMEPGDILYIPKGYIHFVYTLSTSAMVSCVF